MSSSPTQARPMVASCRVYKTGSTYIAETWDGRLLNSNTTDASTAIRAAISGIPGAATRGVGGKIFIHAGDYECKTTILADIETLGYGQIQIEGEGFGTRLLFMPTGALTDGLHLRNPEAGLAHMQVWGNSNVTNVIHVQGRAVGNSQNSEGYLHHLQVDGAYQHSGNPGNASGGSIISGQVGIYIDGMTPATYFWTVSDIHLRGLYVGILTRGAHGHAMMAQNIHSIICDTAIKLQAGQNNIDNMWVQGGSKIGRYGIHCSDDSAASGDGDMGNFTLATNVKAELFRSGTSCAAVLIDDGVTHHKFHNIKNDSADIANTWYTVLDNSSPQLHNFTDNRIQLEDIWIGSQEIANDGTLNIRKHSSGSVIIEFGSADSNGDNAFIDFHISDADGDYSSRIGRSPAAGNSLFYFTQTGGNAFEFNSKVNMTSGFNHTGAFTSGASAGGRGAVPATTAGFITCQVSGSLVKIPYFLA